MATATARSFSVVGVIRGYHVYQHIWTPHVGEKATMIREPGNEHDRFAVAVLEEDTLCAVGHLPQEISRECFFFIRRGGRIGVAVTGLRQKSTQQDKGMEIPCILTFTCKDHTLRKSQSTFRRKGFQKPSTQALP